MEQFASLERASAGGRCEAALWKVSENSGIWHLCYQSSTSYTCLGGPAQLEHAQH